MSETRLVHISDLHFGYQVDLEQIDALERQVPELRPAAVILAGDLSQRARHKELFRAQSFARTLARVAPTLALPGNHDVQWWLSPFGVLGLERIYEKYRRYLGRELMSTLELPGVCLASALTSYGVALGSLTWNLNDLAVKGHLPRTETRRLTRIFARQPPGVVRCVVLHHNVLRGEISRRMGLAHWRDAQRRLARTGADLVLCGHDHQEGAGEVDGMVVSTSGTHTSRTRGGRRSAFNLVSLDQSSISIQHYRWDRAGRRFAPSDLARFARRRRSGVVPGDAA